MEHRQSESSDEEESDDGHRSSAQQMGVLPGGVLSDSDSDSDTDIIDDDERDRDDEYYFASFLWKRQFRYRYRYRYMYKGPAPIKSSVAEPSSRSFTDLNLSPQRRTLYHALVEKLERIGTTMGQYPKQTLAAIKSEQQDIMAAIGMLLVMDEGEFGFWKGLYGGKLFERDAHWDVKYPAKAREVLEACMLPLHLIIPESSCG
jgi:hypothetical protein